MENQKGIIHIPILIGVIAIMGFLFISSYAPLKDRLLSSLYPKEHSEASQALPSDINSDGVVNTPDLSVLLSRWGGNDTLSDLNSNGQVEIGDLSALLSSWGKVASNFHFHLYDAPKEIVPAFCTTAYLGSSATIITSIKSGNFTDPNTWSNNQVPSANAVVQILPNHQITYDAPPSQNITLDCLRIADGGVLKFRNDADTKLTVGTMVVLGYLEIGTVNSPIQASKKAEIVIADKALDVNTTTPSQSKDPNQMGTGLLVLKNGKLRIHGDKKINDTNPLNQNSHAFIRLASEPKAGNTTIATSEDVNSYNWKTGDTLIIPDTRQVSGSSASSDARNIGFTIQTERPTIQSVSSDGKTITLTQALQFDHLGAKDISGQIKFLPHVGNISRNVIIRSANPNGTRGHSLYSERADVDIRYAQFKDMGRTKASVGLDSVAYDSNGNITKIGTNQIGRYSMHFHHDMGLERSPAEQVDPNIFQVTVIGNSILDDNKWGITVHDTHFGLFKNNTIVGARGSAIMLEQGNEFKNVIEGNFLVESRGPVPEYIPLMEGGIHSRGPIDFGWEGTGIWTMSPFSYIRNNVASDTVDSGFTFYLHSHIDAALRASSIVPSKNYVIKNDYNVDGYDIGLGNGQDIRGADTYNPAESTTLPHINSEFNPQNRTAEARLAEFKNNESYGVMERGAHLWGGGPGALIEDFRVWNIYYAGFQTSYTGDHLPNGNVVDFGALKLKNVTVLGDPSKLKAKEAEFAQSWDSTNTPLNGFKFKHLRYSGNMILDGMDIQGMLVGIEPAEKKTNINNAFLRNYHNIKLFLPDSRLPRDIKITNTTFASLPNVTLTPFPQYDFFTTMHNSATLELSEAFSGTMSSRWDHYTKPQIFRVYNYVSDGVNHGDIRIYHAQQSPNTNIKQLDTVFNATSSFPSITNQQALSQYGSSIGDGIAPCTNNLGGKVSGFACPLSDPNTQPTYYPIGSSEFITLLETTTDNPVFYNFNVNGTTIGKNFPLLNLGVNFLTFSDLDVIDKSLIDINKNGVVDQNEKFKKSHALEKK